MEASIGYRLRAFYVALMRERNGGIPANTCFLTTEATSWADDYIATTGIARFPPITGGILILHQSADRNFPSFQQG